MTDFTSKELIEFIDMEIAMWEDMKGSIPITTDAAFQHSAKLRAIRERIEEASD